MHHNFLPHLMQLVPFLFYFLPLPMRPPLVSVNPYTYFCLLLFEDENTQILKKKWELLLAPNTMLDLSVVESHTAT